MRQAGATLHRGARASHYRGLSCCGAQAPDAQAQELWLTGLATPQHVGSSQTRARTHVPCIGRRILNHCATREAHFGEFCFSFSNCFRCKVRFLLFFLGCLFEMFLVSCGRIVLLYTSFLQLLWLHPIGLGSSCFHCRSFLGIV